jgi:hypothetical protein
MAIKVCLVKKKKKSTREIEFIWTELYIDVSTKRIGTVCVRDVLLKNNGGVGEFFFP